MRYSPLVSVIMPSYNHAQYIERAVESVLRQTYRNFELIINDDGSSDETHKRLERFENIENITIIKNSINRCQSYVLNEAIDIAKGEFISIIYSDDWYLETKLQRQLELFENLGSEVGVVYSNGLMYQESTGSYKAHSQVLRKGYILKALVLEPFFIPPISGLFRRECFDSERFDTSFRAEGEAIYVKLAQHYKFDFVPDHLVVMRTHTYNVGSNLEIMVRDNIRWWHEFLYENEKLPLEAYAYRGKGYARICRLYGLESVVRSANLMRGRTLLINATRYDSSTLLDYKLIIGVIITFLPVKLVRFILRVRNRIRFRRISVKVK